MINKEKRIEEIKISLQKKEGREITDDEANKVYDFLHILADITVRHVMKTQERDNKLKQYPNGFSIKGEGYSCCICGYAAAWYDNYGNKCEFCQASINRKEVPVSIVIDKNKWYSKFDLESYFNLKGKSLNNWIKKGLLKQRIMTKDGKRIHIQMFLIKDNKDMLPPKKLLKGGLVRVVENGQEWIQSEPWYKFVDPHKHLKGYKIMDYLKVLYDSIE